MKNLVDPIKLTEPVKPVNNQSLSVNQQKPQQQGEQANGKNDFQAMLDKQVQERRQQNQTLEENKQQNKTAEKSKTANQSKTDANAKVSSKEDIGTNQDSVEKILTENASKGDVKPQGDHTKHSSVKTHTSKEASQPSNDPKFVKNAKNSAEEAHAPLAKKEVETDSKSTNQQKNAVVAEHSTHHKAKVLKHAKDAPHVQTEKTASTNEHATQPIEEPETAQQSVASKQATTTHAETEHDEPAALIADNQQHEHVDAHAVPVAKTKTPEVHASHTAEPKVAKDIKDTKLDQHPLHLAPATDKLVKQAGKQAVNASGQTHAHASVAEATHAEETTDAKAVLAQTAVKSTENNETAPKQSVIAELQKTALDKRQQAKQLQKDMGMAQLKSTAAKERLAERGELETVAAPRSDRSADFMQTMNLHAATAKSVAQRPLQADSFKADELKAAVNKTTENATPLASTQTTVGTNAALQASSVMAAAPLGSSNQIYAYPGKSGWNQAISQKVMYMVGASEQTARLSLNPPELGPLQVVIEVNDEKANTTFISDNEEVRQALEDGMDYLREKMDEAGISLGEANVNDGQRFNQQRQQEGFAENFKQNNRAQNMPGPATEQIVTTAKVQSNTNGLVDTFA